MKYILIVLSIIMAVATVFFIGMNQAFDYMLVIPFTEYNFAIKTTCFAYIGWFLGLCSGILIAIGLALNEQEKLMPFKRQLEKLTVNSEAGDSQVKVLEAKIKTLEIALEQALKNKQ